MSDSSVELKEITALIVSPNGGNKPLAYSMLLHLQEQSSEDASSIPALVDGCNGLVSHLVVDISAEDEEVAALALKCLGFMIYHPTIVAAIPESVAGVVLASIADVARTTKMKLICNLGMWCISMQQFNEKVLNGHFQLLVKAVLHAIDNPFGSLSTTFEAFQAVIKLANQTGQKMRESSDMWLPPVYRRLLSNDKRVRDMADRCLSKIKSTVIPPQLMLFKAVDIDLKEILLMRMKEMLKDGFKVQAVQAWAWFIRLLGSYATKDRHVLNAMLKVLESTFLDSDPQVQIASQVAWQGLIDAVIPPLLTVKETNKNKQTPIRQKFAVDITENLLNQLLKIVKLIMTPIVGIVSSKCDLSVHSACFDSWCFLLHKLDILVNHESVRIMVLQPIFEVVFQKRSESMRNGSWKLYLDILDHSIQSLEGMRTCLNSQTSQNAFPESSKQGALSFDLFNGRQYPIKWLPLDHSQLNFHLEVIKMLLEGSVARVFKGHSNVQHDDALRIFRSLLQVIQGDLKSPSAKYDDILLSVKSILSFVKQICEEFNSENKDINETCQISLLFVRVISEELEPSFLESPLYKVPLDVKYIEQLNFVVGATQTKNPPIYGFSYMDMVSPMAYLVALYFSVLFQSNQAVRAAKVMEEEILKFMQFILSSSGSLENLAIIDVFFYRHLDFTCLKLWKAVALGLREFLDSRNCHFLVQLVSNSQLAIVHFLTYPVYAFSCCTDNGTSLKDASNEFLISVRKDIDLDNVGRVWVSLYSSISREDLLHSTANTFSDQLCSTLNDCIQGNTAQQVFRESVSCSNSGLALTSYILSLYGIMLTSILEWILNRKVSSNDERIIQSDSVLHFTKRFLVLSMADIAKEYSTPLELTSRVLDSLAHLVGRITLKQEILSFVEIFSDPLALWLSQTKSSPTNSIHDKLELLSVEALRCSIRSRPPIEFDSLHLKVQAHLLEQTLDHLKQSVCDPAVSFWNSTYGEQRKLDYPTTLLGILDKLWRNGWIHLGKRSHAFKEPKEMYGVTTSMQSRTSKRVELLEASSKQLEHDGSFVREKRKWSELTEHQKEVRRAQQGRARDCEGHGPGIRTYTMADFSQGDEDSQEGHENESQGKEEPTRIS